MHLLRRLLASALVSLMATLGLSSCTPKPPPLRVEFWGDSIGWQTAPYFNYFHEPRSRLPGHLTVRLVAGDQE
jgi:hypothetical protein